MSKPANKYLGMGQVIFGALIAVALCAASTSSTVQAKPKKAKYGTIKILSTPGGLRSP